MQINCFGLSVLGFLRKAELIFAVGRAAGLSSSDRAIGWIGLHGIFRDPLQNGREVSSRAAIFYKGLIKCAGMFAHSRGHASIFGGLLAKLQIFEHEVGGKARLVVVVGWGLRPHARSGAIGGHRPALP